VNAATCIREEFTKKKQEATMNRKSFLRLGLAGIISSIAPEAWALKFYPNPSGKKWAVLYATWCGTSRDAAVWISEGMGGIADVFDVRENPDLSGFDNVIVGSSIRSFTIHPLLEKYLNDNKNVLKGKIRGYFAACNNMGRPPGPQEKANYIDNKLAKICETGNVPGKVFPGRITKELIEPENRAMFASFQDNDNLKRADCMAFGKEILKSV
jgi:menaquinone-dependent protoporphyrinogen IX oxidase